MTSFFPDVNVWLALSVESHAHAARAWRWLNELTPNSTLIFSRYTQLGFLRLLTNSTVMGRQALTIGEAWSAWDQWIDDPRVEYRGESRGLDQEFRAVLEPFAAQKAWQWVGDGFILAQAKQAQAALVTFDKALWREASRQGNRCVIPPEK